MSPCVPIYVSASSPWFPGEEVPSLRERSAEMDLSNARLATPAPPLPQDSYHSQRRVASLAPCICIVPCHGYGFLFLLAILRYPACPLTRTSGIRTSKTSPGNPASMWYIPRRAETALDEGGLTRFLALDGIGFANARVTRIVSSSSKAQLISGPR